MAEKDLIKKNELIYVFILMFFTVLFRAQAGSMPLDTNEGTYAYAASIISHGSVLYRDVFEQAPPMINYVYKTAFAVFGSNSGAVRTFTTMYILAVIALLYILARVVWRSAFMAMLTTLFYAIYQHGFIFSGFCADTSVYAQLPLLASLLFAADRDAKYESVNLCVSGFFAATAFITHQMTFAFVFVPTAYILAYGGKKKLQNLAWFFAGYAAVIAAAAVWALLTGALKDMFTGLFVYGSEIMKKGVKAPEREYIVGDSAVITALLVPMIALFYSFYAFLKNRKDGLVFLFSAAAVSLLLPGMLYAKLAQPRDILILMPIAAILTAMLARDMYALIAVDREMKKYAWIILALFLALNAAIFSNANNLGKVMSRGTYAPETYYEEVFLADYILSASRGKNIDKNNFIFAWPELPGMYFLTGAKAASRYISSYALEVFKDNKEREKTMDTMYHGRPSWIIMQKGTYSSSQAFLDNYYALETQTKNLALYRNILFN